MITILHSILGMILVPKTSELLRKYLACFSELKSTEWSIVIVDQYYENSHYYATMQMCEKIR